MGTMESRGLTMWFFILTGLLSLITGLIRIKKGYWRVGTKKEKLQIVLLLLWTVVASVVVYASIFGGSGYIYPRAFENI